VVPSGEPNAQDQLSLKQALTVATLIEAETEKPSVEDDPHQNPATDPAIDLEAQALALLFQESWDSVEQIAERLRVDRKTPYKWKRF
jgi:transcriptional regulator with PAS, ATPase and Fis domain